ncbi:MAG: hypoxanthine phosphoribosyltransferase [Bacteroidales bacterium]|nr:hypoxanthine phosphoribosyltransferase [Bacteroidales bacterium]
MDKIQVLDKRFRLYLPESEIQEVVRRVAAELSRDYRGRNPIFCPVLTGSFVFAADLVRQLDFDAEVSFVRYSSYSGMSTTGRVEEVTGFPPSCRNRDVVIVEDIIDSGISMEYMLDRLRLLEPRSIAICTFLFKPGRFKKNYKIDYIGKEIPDDFIVGYGLDFEGVGRTYRDIYVYDGL